MTAISENLSKPCTTEVYKGDKSKEALMKAYIQVLTDFGKCEAQRKKALEYNKNLQKLYKQ